jgi:hypothetical protein
VTLLLRSQNPSRPVGEGYIGIAMIWNVIDHRKRPYRWKAITAIIEPVSHDNSCADSDQADEKDEGAILYDHRAEISLADAVVWAQSQPFAVTLYLYDLGEGIRASTS